MFPFWDGTTYTKRRKVFHCPQLPQTFKNSRVPSSYILNRLRSWHPNMSKVQSRLCASFWLCSDSSLSGRYGHKVGMTRSPKLRKSIAFSRSTFLSADFQLAKGNGTTSQCNIGRNGLPGTSTKQTLSTHPRWFRSRASDEVPGSRENTNKRPGTSPVSRQKRRSTSGSFVSSMNLPPPTGAPWPRRAADNQNPASFRSHTPASPRMHRQNQRPTSTSIPLLTVARC